MMKAFKIFSMAAVAFMMFACSSEDTALDNTPVAGQKVHFTATIAAPGSDASTRTTYTEVTDPSKADYGKIKVAWEQGDEIALIHNGTKDVVTVQTLNADGSANISGPITVGTDGEAVTIVYPAASVNAPTSGAEPVEDATYATKWNSQDGTLTYIQDNLDFCRATSTLIVSGTNATLSSNISMVSTIAIFKFTTKNSNGTATIDVRPLIINIGSQNFVITPASSTNVLYVALPAVSSQTVNFLATSSDGETKYSCSKAGVSFTASNYYQSILKMNLGVLPGKFTINASGGKVYFSQGNLQAVCTSADDDGNTQESWTWRFATNQWDYIGNATANNAINGNGSVSAAGTVDLFGWSTPYTYYGIQNLTGDYSGDFRDWGTLAITNGGNTANSGWRTLTSEEVIYLASFRDGSTVNTTTNARWAYATINTDDGYGGVNGLILFPDGVTFAAGEASWGAIHEPDNWGTKCTSAQWTALAAKGCVFLPAAGWRSEYSNDENGYWSSTSAPLGTSDVLRIVLRDIVGGFVPAAGQEKRFGFSVRLVRDAE